MYAMFYCSKFDKDISSWDVRNVKEKASIFYSCPIRDEYKPKFDVKEAFDFGTVNKQHNIKTVHEILRKQLDIVVQKIIDGEVLTVEDVKFIDILPDGSYCTDNRKIRMLTTSVMKSLGYNCSLNWINTSKVTNMAGLFEYVKFKGDISNWDVSNVTNMERMFYNSNFNGDISRWDVSNVTNMNEMFATSIFKGDIDKWNVSNVTTMKGMFE
jgi:surface protein